MGKTFFGDRSSLSLLLSELTAYYVGQLVAIDEHRIAVQGFVWSINSFDQWRVNLGTVLSSALHLPLNLKVAAEAENLLTKSMSTLDTFSLKECHVLARKQQTKQL
ncbi:PREDICTED: glucose-6-phosphate isomerase, cytosolic 2B-like [Camelina sativa]|uniref:Glucose-6-phosphate isomerase n=1 Tax=Camelina sativa TaxID=90675 RepID=A0ABM1RFG9_CAMSA|nr:PREDICTED: glucose-6-phosphate isomerase, cytosolic 2B-like [Camelina sativa]